MKLKRGRGCQFELREERQPEGYLNRYQIPHGGLSLWQPARERMSQKSSRSGEQRLPAIRSPVTTSARPPNIDVVIERDGTRELLPMRSGSTRWRANLKRCWRC
jgi:hypothetical protein